MTLSSAAWVLARIFSKVPSTGCSAMMAKLGTASKKVCYSIGNLTLKKGLVGSNIQDVSSEYDPIEDERGRWNLF